MSTVILVCVSCGRTTTGAARSDAERAERNRRDSARLRRRQPIDEGPPTNPVLDADTARRLLDGLEG